MNTGQIIAVQDAAMDRAMHHLNRRIKEKTKQLAAMEDRDRRSVLQNPIKARNIDTLKASIRADSVEAGRTALSALTSDEKRMDPGEYSHADVAAAIVYGRRGARRGRREKALLQRDRADLVRLLHMEAPSH
uniref:Uncharacterized protein n=1 Tax=Cryptomonas curvata TaxID=233186 RepID=A0A7S0QN75_9CRYP|mmetsp:Transcript_37961/g.79504  ORF Transcript_37961/g.79504 Transcript_37961/m.79504 type:complete len:132 (+) Transcript_37961:161-556(+)